MNDLRNFEYSVKFHRDFGKFVLVGFVSIILGLILCMVSDNIALTQCVFAIVPLGILIYLFAMQRIKTMRKYTKRVIGLFLVWCLLNGFMLFIVAMPSYTDLYVQDTTLGNYICTMSILLILGYCFRILPFPLKKDYF